MGDNPFSPRSSDYSSYPTPSYQPGNEADDELDYEDDHKEPAQHKKMMYHSELFFGEQDSENTSEGSSSGRNSPAPSVYSYHSSIDGSVLLRDLHGRVINSTSERYALPADSEEHGRLDIQHEMLKRKRNGLFFAQQAVRRALAPREGVERAALDVGSGSGSWLFDMAKQFPHVDFLGIDLAPANLNMTPPPNCRFECDDVNLGITHYKNCFDVIHMSCITPGIENYRKLMDEAAECLRPGGVYLTVEGDMNVHDENGDLVPELNEGDPGFTWTLRLVYAVREAMRARGPGNDNATKIYAFLQDQGPIWKTIGQKVIYIPVGPWEEKMSDKDRLTSEMMRQNFLRMVRSVRPLLLSFGYFEETVDKWSAGAIDEIENMKNKYYVRWLFTWAVKPGKP
ncbi:hypothetical protein FS837_012700 [Tulasnella sp. UAMH 9824]|nr:hypothetical protein FS837_012700 [Tulasnella sp. UAMH 9824]